MIKNIKKKVTLARFVAGCNSGKKNLTFPFPTKFFGLLFNVTLHLAASR